MVKNQQAADVQITAEQLIRDSQAYRMDDHLPPKMKITDKQEEFEYKYRMRNELEEKVRRQPHHMGNWIKYAEWEASMGEFKRMRSVYERAIEVDYQHVPLWLKYAEVEMAQKFVSHARNIWERACKFLPRVD